MSQEDRQRVAPWREDTLEKGYVGCYEGINALSVLPFSGLESEGASISSVAFQSTGPTITSASTSSCCV